MKTVAAGHIHSIVLKQDGSVWAAGRNDNGQLGDGSNADRNKFVQVMSGGAAQRMWLQVTTDASLVCGQQVGTSMANWVMVLQKTG